jgi:hypothetical protein
MTNRDVSVLPTQDTKISRRVDSFLKVITDLGRLNGRVKLPQYICLSSLINPSRLNRFKELIQNLKCGFDFALFNPVFVPYIRCSELINTKNLYFRAKMHSYCFGIRGGHENLEIL